VARWRIDKAFLESRPGAFLAGRIAALFLRTLGATWRISVEGPDPFSTGPGPHLAAFWHRNALIAAFVFRNRGFGVPVSRSRDGDLITQLLLGLGYRMPARGSSSRGGAAALRALMRMIEQGITISIQTDGPRGPARVSKHGMVSLARRTGRPISPLAFSARPCMRFRSWDGTLLPLPFARVLCSYGPEILVPHDAEPRDEETIRGELDRELNRLTDEADARFGFEDPNRARP
jgi:hypothetical protein